MRIWSLHPKYLDSKGLVALWRETLLAQNVLKGNTVGYKNHPQLLRFKNEKSPLGAIAQYLKSISDEAIERKYNFDRSKINNNRFNSLIPVTTGQIEYEKNHLLQKLKIRDKRLYKVLLDEDHLEVHPLFKLVKGDIEPWEII